MDAKKDLNVLKEIKNVELMKYKKRTPGHKKLINLFNNLLDTILTDKTLKSENQENENEKVESAEKNKMMIMNMKMNMMIIKINMNMMIIKMNMNMKMKMMKQ